MDSNIRRLIPKYKKALIIILAYYALVLGLVFYGSSRGAFGGHERYLTPLIPINNQYAEMALIFLVFTPISALIGGLIGGYFLAPAFLFIHKNFLGSKMLYGIQDRRQPQTFKKIIRGLFPALLAININSIIYFSAPWVLDLILNTKVEGLPVYSPIFQSVYDLLVYYLGFVVLSMFTIGLGTLVFSPTWFLTDAGIVYSNKEKVAGTDRPVEGRTVGGRFTDFLRGYAGLGVALSYLQLLSVRFFSEGVLQEFDPIGLIATITGFFGLPIFMLIAVIPSLIILDITKERRIRFVRNFAEKMGITDFVEISFEKVK